MNVAVPILRINTQTCQNCGETETYSQLFTRTITPGSITHYQPCLEPPHPDVQIQKELAKPYPVARCAKCVEGKLLTSQQVGKMWQSTLVEYEARISSEKVKAARAAIGHPEDNSDLL